MTGSETTRVRVEEVTPKLAPVIEQLRAEAQPPPPPLQAQPDTVSEREDMLFRAIKSAFAMLAFSLSARAILLLTIVGAFALGMVGMGDPSTLRLLILIAYCVLVVIPCALLEARKMRREAP
jgi:hypothetical protein